MCGLPACPRARCFHARVRRSTFIPRRRPSDPRVVWGKNSTFGKARGVFFPSAAWEFGHDPGSETAVNSLCGMHLQASAATWHGTCSEEAV